MSKPIALITGASKGLGLAVAKRLMQEGYKVYGTSRNPELISEKHGIEFIKMDLDKPETIDELFVKLPKIDLLVNNAGFSQVGTVEEISMENVRNIFEVNLFNQIYLTKLYIPQMRERQSGTIINITSMAGTTPVPFSTIYAAVKGSFDSFTKGLRNELYYYGIKVFAVAPFQMHTTIPQTNDYEVNSPYKEHLTIAKKMRDRAIDEAEDPDYIANQIMKLIKKKNPRVHNPVGKNHRLLSCLIWLLPQKRVEKLVRKRFGLDY